MADDQAQLEDDVLMPDQEPAEEDDLAELGLEDSEEGEAGHENTAAEAAAELQELEAEAQEDGVNEAAPQEEQAGEDELADPVAQAEEEDDNASVQADEAEEELSQVGKRSDAQEQKDMREHVRKLVGEMEAAMNADRDDCEHGKPATRKLKMLQKARSVVQMSMYQPCARVSLRSGRVTPLASFQRTHLRSTERILLVRAQQPANKDRTHCRLMMRSPRSRCIKFYLAVGLLAS